MSSVVTMKALLESGVHFGHRTNKWNPKMRPYIFTERNGIHIIDLQQTVKLLDEAYDFVRDSVSKGGTILFVGTKRQAQDTIREEAERCGMPYVNQRWLGGTITNWLTIQKRIFELERLERMRDNGQLDLLTKKEGLMVEREIERLDTRLHGLRTMKRVPDVLFVIDVNREDTAVHEANLKNIPVVAVLDTNCDPKNIDYVIPSNDDAIRAIRLMVSKIADAVMEGKAIRSKDIEDEEMLQESMPAEVSRFIEDDDELEDEALLGESTLKHLGASLKPKLSKTTLEEGEESEDEVELGLEDVAEDVVVEEVVAEEDVAEEVVVEEVVAEENVAEEVAAEEVVVEEDVAEEVAAEEVVVEEDVAEEVVSEDDVAEEDVAEEADDSTD